MVRYVMFLGAILLTHVLAFNTVDTIYVKNNDSFVTKKDGYVRVRVKCDNNTCSISKDAVNKARMLAIANLKSVKSWSRDFSNGTAFKYLKTMRVSPTECVITFIICNSADNKMYDNTFGIEVLYKETK